LRRPIPESHAYEKLTGTEVLAALTPTVYNMTENARDRFPPEGDTCERHTYLIHTYV
jgi:hypothetical protein